MKEYAEFHDGSFEGLWIDGKTAHIFLATVERDRFVIVAEDVAELAVEGVRSGNIIFEVFTRDSEEVLPQDIRSLYALQEDSVGDTQCANLLEKVRFQGWRILEINPSYGASCLILASSICLFRREDWTKLQLKPGESESRTASASCRSSREPTLPQAPAPPAADRMGLDDETAMRPPIPHAGR